jgi:hypothetical protein
VFRFGHLGADESDGIGIPDSSNSANISNGGIVNSLRNKTVRNGNGKVIGAGKENRIGSVEGTNGLGDRNRETMNGEKMMRAGSLKKSNRQNKILRNNARTAKPRRSIARLDIGTISMTFEAIDELFLLEGKGVELRKKGVVEEIGLRRYDEGGVEGVKIGRLREKRSYLSLRVEHEGIIHVSKRSDDVQRGRIKISSTIASCYHLIKRRNEGGDMMRKLANFGRFHEERSGGERQKRGKNFIISVKFQRFVGRVRVTEGTVTRKREPLGGKKIMKGIRKMVGIVGERLLKNRNSGIDERSEKNRFRVGASGGIKHVIEGGHG